MSLIVPNVSEVTTLTYLISAMLDGAELHCFQNDVTPTGATVLGDLDEADFDGYDAIVLDSWTAPSTNVDGKAECVETARTFERTSGTMDNDVYGIYVTDALGNLVYVERNPAGPVTMNTPGQQFIYTPRYTLKSEV